MVRVRVHALAALLFSSVIGPAVAVAADVTPPPTEPGAAPAPAAPAGGTNDAAPPADMASKGEASPPAEAKPPRAKPPAGAKPADAKPADAARPKAPPAAVPAPGAAPGTGSPAVRGRDKKLLAHRTASAPTVDGRMDDPVWQHAQAASDFTQIQPAEGKEPSEKTEFRVMYDDENVYFFVHCLDSEPDKIVSRLTRRDRDIEADWVAVTIDSRGDKTSGYTFQLSAAGVQVDGMFYGNDGQFSIDWDGVWNGAVTRDGAGWHAEFAVPLTVLRFSDADVQSWGFQVHRNVSRKREQMLWAWEPGGNIFAPSRFGQVTELTGLRPRRTFELRPYFMSRAVARTERGGAFLGLSPGSSTEGALEVGLDAKIGLTSRLTLDVTLNPDFGQVEADQVVLNLSRFETFFPEKRPFFLEGRDIFETPVQLFYPRRIGRPAVGLRPGNGVLIDDEERTITRAPASLRIWSALKVTGELADGVAVGVLGALTGAETVETEDPGLDTDEVELAPERAYGVLRARYGTGNSGNFVGVAATAATRLDGRVYRATADHDAYSQAIDYQWASPSGELRSVGQFVVSERVGGPTHRLPDGRACSADDAVMNFSCLPIARANGTIMGPGAVGYGGALRASYQTRNRMARFELASSSAKLDLNDAGFQPRFDQNEVKLVGGFMDRKPSGIFNFKGVFPFFVGSVSYSGVPQYGLIGMDLEANFTNHMFSSPEQWILFPGTWDIYETLDGARWENVPGWEGHWATGTNQAKAVSLFTNINWFVGFDGDSGSLSGVAEVRWQAASNIELTLAPELGIDRSTRFYDCSTDSGRGCLVDPGIHHYLFADLASTFSSLTFRGTWTLSPPLSVQAYAQWFTAEGDFSDYREVDTMGEHPEIRRDELRPSAFNGDFDGDGTKDDGFEVASLNVNFVLRWEMLPGSTLFMVYTRAAEAPYVSPGRLDEGPTEDVVLVKFQYFAR